MERILKYTEEKSGAWRYTQKRSGNICDEVSTKKLSVNIEVGLNFSF